MSSALEKTIQNIKKIVDVSELNNYNFDKTKIWITSHHTESNTLLTIPHEATFYWLRVKQYVREKSFRTKIRLSDEFISNQIHNLILEVKTDQKKYEDISRTVKNWVDDLSKLSVSNFLIVLPINNVDYRSDLDLGPVKMVKLTQSLLESNIEFKSKVGHFSSKEIFKDLVTTNETEIFFIIEVQAKDQEQAKELAKLYLKKFVYVMRLFSPNSGITDRDYYYPGTHTWVILYNKDKKSLSTNGTNLHLNAHITPPKQYWQRIQPDWNQLTSFLYSNNHTELQSVILTGLYWYGDAGYDKKNENRPSIFLKYMMGLESMLIFDRKHDKKIRIADRFGKIYSKIHSNYDFYYELMKNYYELRNDAVHAGKVIIENEVIVTTHDWLRNLLFYYIRNSKKYSDIKTMFDKEYSIKLT